MTPHDELRALINGYQVSQAVHVAAVLGISDLLAEGPLSSTELADRAGCDESALRRLVRALSALGLYTEDPADTFSNAELGAALRSDAPTPARDIATNAGRPYNWDSWGHLLASVRSGDNAFRMLNGTSVWEHRAAHPDDAVAFDRAMTAMTIPVVTAVADSYDFTGLSTVVDIGGGQGALLSAVLTANPTSRGVLFDLDYVLKTAPDYLSAHGVDDRVELVPGSFFESIPSSGDVYVLKSVLHDWEDDECAAILQRCREAMRPGAVCSSSSGFWTDPDRAHSPSCRTSTCS